MNEGQIDSARAITKLSRMFGALRRYHRPPTPSFERSLEQMIRDFEPVAEPRWSSEDRLLDAMRLFDDTLRSFEQPSSEPRSTKLKSVFSLCESAAPIASLTGKLDPVERVFGQGEGLAGHGGTQPSGWRLRHALNRFWHVRRAEPPGATFLFLSGRRTYARPSRRTVRRRCNVGDATSR
jgi:hypothetical protein